MLVRSPILNIMVPGIQGERIAQSVNVSARSMHDENQSLEIIPGKFSRKVHKIKSMPCRNGAFTGKNQVLNIFSCRQCL